MKNICRKGRIFIDRAKLFATITDSVVRGVFEPMEINGRKQLHSLDAIVGRESPDGQLRRFRIKGGGVDSGRPESRYLVGNK